MTDENNNSRRRNASFRDLLRTACAIALVWSAMGYVVYWACFEREHSEWSENVRLWDGSTLTIKQTGSQRVYHNIFGPHTGGWGSGDPWGSVSFDSGGKKYRWEEKYIPIAVQLDESGVYIVVYDRETIINHKTGDHQSFRIYRASSPSKWDEIAPAQFPKHLAIQNTWLRKNNGVLMDGKVENEYEVVAQMDPSFYWFRDSLTAKLWSYLEKADFNFDATPSEDFVRQFKAKWIRVPGATDNENEIRPGTKVHFATAVECARLLSSRDVFVQAMSPFDRAARLKTDQDVTEKEYLAFAAKQAQDWSSEEKIKLQAILASIRAKTEQLDLRFPASVSLLKTTGLEEGNAAYCRGNAIVLPTRFIDGGKAGLEHVILHELFHIYRGHYPDNRRALYKIIGFVVCAQIDLPEELRSRKITNPDAPLIDSVIRIRVDGQKVPVTPVLYSKTERYDTKTGGEFFRSMVFQLMVLDEESDGFKPSLLPGGKPRFVDPSDAPDYLDQVGRNTPYIIHPEEILAENFALMVENASSVPSPKIIDQLRSLLTK